MMLSAAIFGVLVVAAAAMAEDSATTTTSTTMAPSADSDADVVVWRHGEQRPANWPFTNFRRPSPTDIIDPGFAPDYYKRLWVPNVPSGQSGVSLPDLEVVRVDVAKIPSEGQREESDGSKTPQAGSSKGGSVEVKDIVRPPPIRIPIDPGFAPDFSQRLRQAMALDTALEGGVDANDTEEETRSEPTRVQNETQRQRRQATAAPAASTTASLVNGLFDISSFPSRMLERLPSGILDPGFAPNSFDRLWRGLQNTRQQQQGQQRTQSPRLYPDLEGEMLDARAPATSGLQRGTQRPFLGIIDQNAFDRFLQGLRHGQQQQRQQVTSPRYEVEGANLDARSLATAGQNRQEGVQRLPEAAREMFQGLGQLGSDVLDRLNVYRNEKAFADFLQNMHQPSSSRDFFANLFRKEQTS